MTSSLIRPVWLDQAGRRLLEDWPLKMGGTVFGMVAFFAAYFWLLNHPLRDVTIMPVTAVDRWIGLQPAALPLYLSLWLQVSLAPALTSGRRELVACGAAWVGLSLVGLGIFLVWPTAVPASEVNWSQHPSLAFLKSADAAGNACPSLHVAFAVFSAAWIARQLTQLGAGPLARSANWIWCVAIAYSTLATRQHVFVDVVAGAGLGAVVAVASGWRGPRTRQN
jgi:membrane-associated phospholipid phosphatase